MIAIIVAVAVVNFYSRSTSVFVNVFVHVAAYIAVAVSVSVSLSVFDHDKRICR